MGRAGFLEKRILDKESEFKDGKLDLPSPLAQPPKCPECTSQRVWKDGLRKTKHGDVQRWLCRDCGYRFSRTEPKNSSEPLKKPSRWSINTASTYTLDRQVCEFLTEGSKNLAKVQSRIEKRAAGATKLSDADIKGKIVEFAWWMKKQGYAESSIESRGWIMKSLVNHGANLYAPESVKETIANQKEWSDQYKVNVVYAYTCFLTMEGLTWKPPNYKRREKLPWIPLEKELGQLITACGKVMGTFLQGLKETGADPGELCRIKWIDLDEKRKTIAINHPVKGHNARIIKVSEDLIKRLKLLPRKSNRIFNTSRKCMNINFNQQRKRIARQFVNPRLLEIKFTTFRHWKATTEYHRTRDILYVKQLLGHKNLSSTMIYIDMEKAIYGGEEHNEYITRAATSLKGARALIEAGFEKADEIDGVHIYRKRK